MPVQPSDLLHFAEDIAQSHAEDEVALRTATSRAYYAAYHDCVAWHQHLPSEGDSKGQHGMHQMLINRLQNPTISPTSNAPLWRKSLRRGLMLKTLKALRSTADYKLPISIEVIQSDAKNAIEQAKTILNLN